MNGKKCLARNMRYIWNLFDYNCTWISTKDHYTLECTERTTTQLHSAKPELNFCAGSNPACSVLEIRDSESLWQRSRMEIRLNTFHWSTKPQKQFIIIIIITIIIIIIIIIIIKVFIKGDKLILHIIFGELLKIICADSFLFSLIYIGTNQFSVLLYLLVNLLVYMLFNNRIFTK